MRVRAIVLASLGVAGAIAACVGSDPDATPARDDASAGDATNGGDGGPGVDGGGDPPADGGADADVDACAGKDLSTDSRHCGGCFHDCALGECMGGKCQPWDVTTAAGTVSGLDVEGTGDRVYFGVGADVWRVQIDGGAPEKMSTLPAAAGVSNLTRSGLGMLACSSQGIHQIPPSAGAPTQVFPSVTSCTGIVADGTTIWATTTDSIFEIRTNPTNQTITHPAPPFPNQPQGDIDVDGAYLYFLSDNNGVRRVSKTAVDAGSTRVGPDAFSSPQGLAVTSEHAYVTAFTPRALSRIALDGGALTELVSLDGGGYTYSQRAARSPTSKAVFFAVGSRVVGFVPPP